MLSKLATLFRTVKHLKVTQLQYRLRYLILAKLKINQRPPQLSEAPRGYLLSFKGIPKAYTAKIHQNTFTFLNKSMNFIEREIDWNFSGYGKLWTYNLNYFEFLHLSTLSIERKIELLLNHATRRAILKDALEPYPISLRLINTIRFISREKPTKNIDVINKALYSDALFLRKNLEYHLLGNHLLENGFALMIASYYFQNDEWKSKALEILSAELTEQMQQDGGHFEQSPMYHCIMLHRVLEVIDLVEQNSWEKDENFGFFFKNKAKQMLGWLQSMTFDNGEQPMLNDAAYGIAPTTKELMDYATLLGISSDYTAYSLGESGYRMWKNAPWEVMIDVGKVASDYQPGHAHADTFSFVLHYNHKPIIVDLGTSTYEKNDQRQYERSTKAHNTIAYAGLDSSEVWGGFRVGRRAKVNILSESETIIKAVHDGYSYLKVKHQRQFSLQNGLLEIIDTLQGKLNKPSIYSLHFHPECQLSLSQNRLTIDGVLEINFENIQDLRLESYLFALGFNKHVEANKIVGKINKSGKTKIKAI